MTGGFSGSLIFVGVELTCLNFTRESIAYGDRCIAFDLGERFGAPPNPMTKTG